jgi:membrane-bound lytic murein transglycosylase A
VSPGRGRAFAARGLAAILAGLLMRACIVAPPDYAPPPPPQALAPPVRQSAPPPWPGPPRAHASETFERLAGWDRENHAAALRMFQASCGVSRDRALRAVCLKARALGPAREPQALAFWEREFRLERVGAPGAEEGLLTGYFALEYPARAVRRWPYTAPVRPRPADLPAADIGVQPVTQPYADRAAIERTLPARALAWMKPEDLFFLQIQGSGVLDLPGGRRLRAVYAANNGQPFVGIANLMKAQGLLAADNTSGEAIRAWLAANRGPRAQALMRADPRYIFFTLEPYDGRESQGAAGAILAPGRSLAVDPARHAYGAVYWIEAEAPALAGAFPAYRRLAMALDTGVAIKGEVRADLYLGTGPAAGAEAGRVKHRLRLYRLVPVADPALAAAGP